jgi:hypothetical protein
MSSMGWCTTEGHGQYWRQSSLFEEGGYGDMVRKEREWAGLKARLLQLRKMGCLCYHRRPVVSEAR